MATSIHPQPQSPAQPLRQEPASPQAARFRTGLARVLAPSFSDCFFIALIVWLFIWGASGWISLLGDGDTGWHIRTGQYILEHHAVPDPGFVLVLAPRRAVVCLGMADRRDRMQLLFQMGGLKAIVLMAGVDDCAVCHRDVCATRCGGAPTHWWPSFTTLLAVGASSMHFLARPHLFTLLFAAAVFVGGGSGSPEEHALALGADSADRAVDQPAWRLRHFPGVPWAAGAGVRDRSGAGAGGAGAGWRQIRRYSALLAGMFAGIARSIPMESSCTFTSSNICAPIGSRTSCRSFKRRPFAPKASSNLRRFCWPA